MQGNWGNRRCLTSAVEVAWLEIAAFYVQLDIIRELRSPNPSLYVGPDPCLCKAVKFELSIGASFDLAFR